MFASLLGTQLPQYMSRAMLGGVLVIGLLLLFAAPLHKKYHFTKKHFYGSLVICIMAVTVALIVANLALSIHSIQGGLTRRTADLSIVACGQEVSLRSQSMLMASSGNGMYTVTDSGVMRYLGYMQPDSFDASLGSFFRAFGGSISPNIVTVPTSKQLNSQNQLAQFLKTNNLGESYLELRSGSACSVTPSMISIYVYSYSPASSKYEWSRIIEHPERYTLSNQPNERRDCIVVMYGEPKDKSQTTCGGYPEASQINNQIAKEMSL